MIIILKKSSYSIVKSVNRNIIIYTAIYDRTKHIQFSIVSENIKKRPTNAYTFIITPQYLKRVEVEE